MPPQINSSRSPRATAALAREIFPIKQEARSTGVTIVAASTGPCQSNCVIPADTIAEPAHALDIGEDPVVICDTVVQVERGVDGLASFVVTQGG